MWPLPLGHDLAFAAGVALALLGLRLLVAGVLGLGSLDRTSGLKVDALVTSGVYRWTRNPQNVGWMLFLLGMATWGRSGLALLLVAFLGALLHAYLVKVEEPFLQRTFGARYRAYRERTPRYLGWLAASVEEVMLHAHREEPKDDDQ